MKLSFTRHAKIRIEERSGLSLDEVSQIFENRKTIPLGQDPGTDKVHHLFWSERDGECFVLVVDEKEGDAITFLNRDFHNRWRLDAGSIQQAKDAIKDFVFVENSVDESTNKQPLNGDKFPEGLEIGDPNYYDFFYLRDGKKKKIWIPNTHARLCW